MEIRSTVNITVLTVVLLCVVTKTTRGASVGNKLKTETMCHEQCVCTVTEMLCPGANITDVLNYGIHLQVLHVDFSNTMLTAFPVEVMYMANCKKLNLSSNHIRSMDQFSLQKLWNLEELVLSNNSIKDIALISPSVIFFNNNNIKVLNLSHNPLTDLGWDTSSTLYSESLEVLDVSRCQITSLDGSVTLRGLKRLAYLDLSHNPLKRLDALYSDTLKILNVRSCLLDHIGYDALANLKMLDVLDTSQNDRLDLDNIIRAPTLKTLDVSACSVRTPNLHGLTELRSAFLNGNRIRQLTAYQFANNTKLFTLDLSKNHLEFVDKLAFDGLLSLLVLDLSSNMIADISWDVTMAAAMPSLDMLNLSHNMISRVGTLKSRSLRRLDLSYCWIELMPNDAIPWLEQLTELDLSHNPLQSLMPGSFNSSHLSLLDLSYCRISHLSSYEFVNSPGLREVRLTGNRLVSLKNGTFAKCPNLKNVYLDDNPWRCDCYTANFAYMVSLVNKTSKNPTVNREPLCLSPDNVTGVTWYVACGNSSAYKSGGREIHRRNFSMAIGVVLILCVSAMMAIFVAVHENMKTRQAVLMQQQGLEDYADGGHHQDDGYGGHSEWADGNGSHRRTAENGEYAAASFAKLSQLPTYEEAVMLSRKPGPRRVKRHSYTQTTDAGVAAAVDDTEATAANRLLGDDGDQVTADTDSDAVGDRLLSRPPGTPTRHRVTEL